MERRELLAAASLSMGVFGGCLGRRGTDTPAELSNGETSVEAPSGDAVRWTYQTGGSVSNQPTLQDGVVYVDGGSNDRATSDRDHVRPERSENVYALTADTGNEQWHYEAAAGIASAPIARDGVFVVVGWNAGTHGIAQRLVRLDDGSETWTTELHDRFLHLLDISNETAYLGTSDDERGVSGEKLFAIRVSNGNKDWSIEAGDTTDAAIHGDTLYAVEGSHRTTAFAVSDGSERWHRDMRPATDGPCVSDKVLHLESERENQNGNYPVTAVSAAEGSERWRFSVPVDEPFVPTGAVASDDLVYITEYGGWLYAVDRVDGTERWRYSTDGETRNRPVVVDDSVYLASMDGNIHAVDATSGDRLWKQAVPPRTRIAAGNRQGLIVRGGNDEESQHFSAYTPDGTELWSFSYEGLLTQPAVDGTEVIVGTKTGYVAALGEM